MVSTKTSQPKSNDAKQKEFFWDENGKQSYDMSSQLVNMNIGHGNKKVIKAIQEQVAKLPYAAPGFATDVKSQLAEMVIDIAPDNMGKVFFTLGGSEANENAIKIAKMYTGRHKIFSRYRSYHGSTYGSANLTGEPRRYASEPGIPGLLNFLIHILTRHPFNLAARKKASKFLLTA